jgi:queuosine precursor transporter
MQFNNTSLITDPVVTASRPHKYLSILGMVWVSILIIGFLTGQKTTSIGGIVFSISILAYPLTYLFGDIFTEVYGFRVSRKIIWSGFFCALLVSGISYIYSIVPSNPTFIDNAAFDLIFRGSPIAVIIGILSFSTGEYINSLVVAKLKLWTNGSKEGLRFIASTFFGQLFDNSIYVIGNFLLLGWYTVGDITSLILSTVIFCTVWETIALPFTYRIVSWLKQKEGIDTYDRGTNFNPFRL